MNKATYLINVMHSLKVDSVIQAIRMAIKDGISECWETNENINRPTIFTFNYLDGSQLHIDTQGHVTCANSDCEYWIY